MCVALPVPVLDVDPLDDEPSPQVIVYDQGPSPQQTTELPSVLRTAQVCWYPALTWVKVPGKIGGAWPLRLSPQKATVLSDLSPQV